MISSKLEDRISTLNNYIDKDDWNTKAQEYIDFIRRNTLSTSGNYDYPGLEVTGIRNIIDDVVNSLSLYIWRGNEKMFEIVHKENENNVLKEVSNKIQDLINEPRSNFVPTLQKVIRDWMEFGMGSCMYFEEGKKELFFKSINPLKLSVSFDSYERPDEFFLQKEFRKMKDTGRESDDISLLYHWIKKDKKWQYSEYEKTAEEKEYNRKTKQEHDKQSLFIVRYNTTSDCMLAKGKGLLMLSTLKLINNIYENLCDVGSQKINKVILLDESTAMSLNKLGQTFSDQCTPISLPIATVRTEGKLLSVLDNNSAPQLAQWLYEITTAIVQQTFSINRLLSVQQKQMTATEVNHRAELDQKYIDFATQTFKNEFLDILVRNLMYLFKKEFEGKPEDYKIIWSDNNNKILVNERLQEINAAIETLGRLKTLGQNFNMNTEQAEEEVSRLTDFASIASTQESAAGTFLSAALEARARGDNNAV